MTRLLPLGVVVWAAGAMLGEGVAGAGAGLAAAGLLAEHRFRIVREHAIGLSLVAGWVAFAVLSTMWAPRPLASGAPFSSVHVVFFGLAWIAAGEADDRTRRALVVTVAVIAALSGAFCIVQHYKELPYFESVERWIPMHRIYEPAEGGGFKAGGLHFHRLKYAHTLVPMMLACVPLGWRLFARRGRALMIAAFTIGVAGMWFAYVSAAWIALVIGGVLGLEMFTRWPRAATLVAMGLAGPLLLAAIADVPVDRQIAWHTALRLFSTHPFVGVGYGGYASAALPAMGGVTDARYPNIYFDAHSVLLQVLAEGGVVGAALFLALGWRYGRLVRDGVGAAFTGVLAACVVLAGVHNVFFHPVVVSACALALALSAQRNAPAGKRDR